MKQKNAAPVVATHTPADEKHSRLELHAVQYGGYVIRSPVGDFGRGGGAVAAFSTLDEALGWLRDNTLVIAWVLE